MREELSYRHQLFCYKYVETQNATEAYLQAGYKVSREVARRNGARLLTNADVLAFINKIQKDLVRETKVTVKQVILQLSKIAFSNGIGAIVSVKDGQFFIREDADLDNVILLSQKIYESKKKKSKSFALKTEDRIRALDLLCEILGFYEESPSQKAHQNLAGNANRILELLKRHSQYKNRIDK